MYGHSLFGRRLARAAVIIFTIVPSVGTAAPLRFLKVDVPLAGLVNLKHGTDVIQSLEENYPNLRALAIPLGADSLPGAVGYYDKMLNHRSEGKFLAAGDPVGDPERPYLDEDLIIFRAPTPRYVVQHEVLHYLVDLAERVRGYGTVTLKANLSKVLLRDSSKDLVDLLNLRLDVLRRSSFEEVAMVDYMLTHRVALGINDDQARDELHFGATNLTEAVRGFRQVVSGLDQAASEADPRRPMLYSRIAAVADDIDAVTRTFKVIACELNLG